MDWAQLSATLTAVVVGSMVATASTFVLDRQRRRSERRERAHERAIDFRRSNLMALQEVLGESLDRLLMAQYVMLVRETGGDAAIDRRENLSAHVKALNALSVYFSRIEDSSTRETVLRFRYLLNVAMLKVGDITSEEMAALDDARLAALNRIAEELRTI